MSRLSEKEAIGLLQDIMRISEEDLNILTELPKIYDKYGGVSVDNFLYQVTLDGQHYHEYLRDKLARVPVFDNFIINTGCGQYKLTHKSSIQIAFSQGIGISIGYKNKNFVIEDHLSDGVSMSSVEIEKLKDEAVSIVSEFNFGIKRALRENAIKSNLLSRLRLFKAACQHIVDSWPRTRTTTKLANVRTAFELLFCSNQKLLDGYKKAKEINDRRVDAIMKKIDRISKKKSWYEDIYPTVYRDIQIVREYLTQIGHEEIVIN